MAYELTIAEGKGRGQRFQFDAHDVTIGRGAENDVVLNGSRRLAHPRAHPALGPGLPIARQRLGQRN